MDIIENKSNDWEINMNSLPVQLPKPSSLTCLPENNVHTTTQKKQSSTKRGESWSFSVNSTVQILSLVLITGVVVFALLVWLRPPFVLGKTHDSVILSTYNTKKILLLVLVSMFIVVVGPYAHQYFHGQ